MTHGSRWLDRVKTLVARWVPFVPLSDHWRIDLFVRKRGYRIADVLYWGRTYALEKDGKRCLFKRTGANGLLVHRDVLPRIRGDFCRLVIPPLIECGCDGRLGSWIITEWVPGRGFSDRWDELDPQTAGGKAIPLDYVDVLLELLDDLRGIDAARFAQTGIERRDRSFLEPRIRTQLDRGRARALLSGRDERRVMEILQPFLAGVDSGPLRLSNHDFYFRNFVELPAGRVALVDWDVARISTFETEHCVTYLWMLMWNHAAWASDFLNRARARFGLDRRRVRAALVVNALNQSMYVWVDRPELQPIPAAALRLALDDASFDALWKPA